jgi:hypothetical protein
MEGEPAALLQQHLEGYFIWHDSSGVHLKAVSGNERHIFSGKIATDGRIENIMTKSVDDSDYCRLSYGDTLKFQLTAESGTAGIDFNIFGGRVARFELFTDGQKTNINQIYFGSEGWHPNDPYFSIRYEDDPPERDHIMFHWFWGIPWPHRHGPRLHH